MVYADSQFTPAIQLLGKWLNPPTLGHAAILEGYRVWPRVSASRSLPEQVGDVVLAVGVLSRSWDSYLYWVDTWSYRRFYKQVFRSLEKANAVELVAEYNRWVAEATKRVEIVSKPKVGSSPIGVGEIGFLIVKLAREFGWTLDQIKSLGYREAVFLATAIDEQDQLVTVMDGDSGEWRKAIYDDAAFNRIKGGGK